MRDTSMKSVFLLVLFFICLGYAFTGISDRALAHLAAGRTAEATACIDSLKTLLPNDPATIFLTAAITRNADAAADLYKAADRSPALPESLRISAQLRIADYYQETAPDSAVAYLQKVVAGKPSNINRQRLAEALLTARDTSGAMAIWEARIALPDGHDASRAWMCVGDVRMARHDWAHALVAFKTAADSPDSSLVFPAKFRACETAIFSGDSAERRILYAALEASGGIDFSGKAYLDSMINPEQSVFSSSDADTAMSTGIDDSSETSIEDSSDTLLNDSTDDSDSSSLDEVNSDTIANIRPDTLSMPKAATVQKVAEPIRNTIPIQKTVVHIDSVILKQKADTTATLPSKLEKQKPNDSASGKVLSTSKKTLLLDSTKTISQTPPKKAVAQQQPVGLQVGVFFSRDNADLMGKRMSDIYGKPVTVASDSGTKGPFYKVIIGSFPTRPLAQTWAKTVLDRDNQPYQAVLLPATK